MSVGGGTLGQELGGLTLVRRSEGAVGEGELDGVVEELLDGNAADSGGNDGLDVDDLDGRLASAMAASHVVVELVDGANAGDVTELFVHVVDSLARSVAEPDSVVLDDGGLLLDLVHRQDLSVGCLELVELTHEIPEAGTRNHVVGREEAHTEHGGVRDGLSGLRATDNHVLVILVPLHTLQCIHSTIPHRQIPLLLVTKPLPFSSKEDVFSLASFSRTYLVDLSHFSSF